MWPNKAKKSQISLGLFSKIKKGQRSWKKAKNYKFGLKKAKLATIELTLFLKQPGNLWTPAFKRKVNIFGYAHAVVVLNWSEIFAILMQFNVLIL